MNSKINIQEININLSSERPRAIAAKRVCLEPLLTSKSKGCCTNDGRL